MKKIKHLAVIIFTTLSMIISFTIPVNAASKGYTYNEKEKMYEFKVVGPNNNVFPEKITLNKKYDYINIKGSLKDYVNWNTKTQFYKNLKSKSGYSKGVYYGYMYQDEDVYRFKLNKKTKVKLKITMPSIGGQKKTEWFNVEIKNCKTGKTVKSYTLRKTLLNSNGKFTKTVTLPSGEYDLKLSASSDIGIRTLCPYYDGKHYKFYTYYNTCYGNYNIKIYY